MFFELAEVSVEVGQLLFALLLVLLQSLDVRRLVRRVLVSEPGQLSVDPEK